VDARQRNDGRECAGGRGGSEPGDRGNNHAGTGHGGAGDQRGRDGRRASG
jgi:hypothetical protein